MYISHSERSIRALSDIMFIWRNKDTRLHASRFSGLNITNRGSNLKFMSDAVHQNDR